MSCLWSPVSPLSSPVSAAGARQDDAAGPAPQAAVEHDGVPQEAAAPGGPRGRRGGAAEERESRERGDDAGAGDDDAAHPQRGRAPAHQHRRPLPGR